MNRNLFLGQKKRACLPLAGGDESHFIAAFFIDFLSAFRMRG